MKNEPLRDLDFEGHIPVGCIKGHKLRRKLESLAKLDGKIATPEFVSQFRLALHWLNDVEHVFVGDSSRNKRTREQKTSKEEKSKFSSGCNGKGAFLLIDNNGGKGEPSPRHSVNARRPITFAMTAFH